ncbi:MAG: hypothetical protein M3N54_10250 [Acidobacteriota bacterium]|nr:hypothetical protein [Acidobacteriota bacterium]
MTDDKLVDTSESREDKLLGIVNSAINTAANAIKQGQIKDVKIPELLKLIQLQKELEEAKPRDINVRWIETWESKPSNEK